MERFRRYVGMIIEAFIMCIIYLLVMPVRVLYSIGNRLISR